MNTVLDAHRPTLGELADGWSQARRRLAYGLLALFVVAVVARVALVGETGSHYVKRGALAFNFLYDAPMRPVAVKGSEIVRLESRRGDLFLQSFAVEPVAIPPNDGEFGGLLPVLAETRIRAQAARYGESFGVVREGKTRVNKLAGYTYVFRFKREGRTFYGRTVLLPTDDPRTRRGVALELLATPASGVGRALDVGLRGGGKKPFRSFRFGTERP